MPLLLLLLLLLLLCVTAVVFNGGGDVDELHQYMVKDYLSAQWE